MVCSLFEEALHTDSRHIFRPTVTLCDLFKDIYKQVILHIDNKIISCQFFHVVKLCKFYPMFGTHQKLEKDSKMIMQPERRN